MSKFGWDLPPGVSISDLPGNRPEEQQMEAFLDAFYNQISKLRLPLIKEEKLEDLSTWIWKQIGDAYSKGYTQALEDQCMAEEQALLEDTIAAAHKDGTMP